MSLDDVFPFEYVGGGYFRRKGVPKGVAAEILHGMDAVRTVVESAERQSSTDLREVAAEAMLAIDILDGNAKPIDWRDGSQPELLRKLCEHLEYHARLQRLESRLASRASRKRPTPDSDGGIMPQAKGASHE